MKVGEWLDRRLGMGQVMGALRRHLAKPVPRHVGWLWTMGTAAAALLGLQVITGVLMMLYYKPTAEGAHESVRRIAEEIPGGWLVRGLHSWGSHFIIALLVLHMIRVFLYGGHKKPRELTWMAGVALLLVTLGFGLTGSLLPWTQLSYWATTVITEGAGALPLVGDLALTLLRGGAQVSEATLGRFFVAHVILLPAALVGLLTIHLYLIARLGIAPIADTRTEEEKGYDALLKGGRPYGAHHLTREIAVALVAVAVLATVTILFAPLLGEKADPLSTPPGIKPEWYFLPIYQVQKYFPGDMGIMSGTTAGVLLAGLLFGLLFLVPFIDRSPERDPPRRAAAIGMGVAVMILTFLLGVLGYLSDRRFEIFGKAYEFDSYGVPHAPAEREGSAPDGR